MANKRISPSEISQLTKKLSSGQDITQDEADRIARLLPTISLETILNCSSLKHCHLFTESLEKWYSAVNEALKSNRTGNFISTIYLYPKLKTKACSNLNNIIIECLSNVDYTKTIQSMGVPPEIAEAIKLVTPTTLKFKYPYNVYGFNFSFCDFSFCDEIRRLGVYPFIENYTPIQSPQLRDFYELHQQSAILSCRPQDKTSYAYCAFVEKRGLQNFILMEAMKRSEIKPILLKSFKKSGEISLCVQEKDMPLVTSWLDVPIESVIERLFSSEKIDSEIAKGLLYEKSQFVKPEAIIEGAKIMKKLAEIKREKENLNAFDSDMLEMMR